METVTRRMGDGWHRFPIYTEEEALERGLTPVPWRKAIKGDWALSDDGYVGECRHIYQSNKGHWRRITLTYGAEWAQSKEPMLYEERRETKNWSAGKNDWSQRDAKKTRARNAIAAYVLMLTSNKKVDWDTLGAIYRPDDGMPAVHVRREFKKRAFREMIQLELEKVLLDQGSSPRRVLEMYQEAFEKAKEKDKPSVMVDVADRFSDLWRLKQALHSGGALPEGLGNVTILEGISTDVQIAKESQNGRRD